jgi:peptidoglycan/xylan/chitin deacetylase (PgdA/CDA1 family)
VTRPRASLSVDLDDLWAYQRTHGDPEWERLGSYLPIAVPRMLDALDAAGCKATVFLVGADAARADGARTLGPIAARGHEVGNHSFGHACWLNRSDSAVIGEELSRADDAIRLATGRAPVGFRGPGFTWSPALLQAVADRGYRFDASTLSSFIGPLARRRLLGSGHFTGAERALRSDLFGSFGDGLRPNRPYQWRLPDGRRLLEIPVTTMPWARVPFHQSYIVYLASFSRRLALGYFRGALAACRVAGVEPSILLHPLDWLGGEEVPELRFFPGMELSASRKVALLHDSLRLLNESFSLETMGAQASRLLQEGGLPERQVPAKRANWNWSGSVPTRPEPWNAVQGGDR